jgi:hypothetical protein
VKPLHQLTARGAWFRGRRSQLAIPFLDGSYAESGIATNVRRRGGSIAHAFSALLKQLVGPDAPSNSVVTPRAFLSCIGAWDARFMGGAQHDSQEFLHSLLDALQTECNRVKGKPAYKELKGTGSEREQAEEAVGYYRTWQVRQRRAAVLQLVAPHRAVDVIAARPLANGRTTRIFPLAWGCQAT